MIICEIRVRVSFLNRTITKKDYGVVEGDYNTTKLVFEFEEDVSDQRIVFKMSNPDGEVILMKDLKDNEVMLAGYDDEGNVYSLFGVAGPHAFELVLYGENSKLTSATGWLAVNKRQVNIGDGNVGEGYLPVLDELLNDVKHMQGESAYEIWLGEGNTGTKADFLASLKGADGSGLPEVTEADNGKILMVVGGKWAIVDFPKGTGGGGSPDVPDVPDVPVEPDEGVTTATYDEATGEITIARFGGIATMYNEENGELTVLHDAATYNDETGEITI